MSSRGHPCSTPCTRYTPSFPNGRSTSVVHTHTREPLCVFTPEYNWPCHRQIDPIRCHGFTPPRMINEVWCACIRPGGIIGAWLLASGALQLAIGDLLLGIGHNRPVVSPPRVCGSRRKPRLAQTSCKRRGRAKMSPRIVKVIGHSPRHQCLRLKKANGKDRY